MKNRTARTILLTIAAAVFLFSSSMVLIQKAQLRAGTEYAETLAQMAVIPHVDTSAAEAQESGVVTADETQGTSPEEVPPVAPIQVDFDGLRAANPDVVAWIYCPDTPINYPVVQTADNAYYLKRLLDGSKNSAGTLFMDYRNADDFSDWNSVIYGHNMKNDSMFGTLSEYAADSYFQSHPELYLLTPEQDYVISVAAGFGTPANAELYTAFCPNDEAKNRLVESWLKSSDFISDDYPTSEDRLITLSTCSYEYDNARYVLIGILKALSRP